MSGTKTFHGNVPASFRRWWLENVYPQHVAALSGDKSGGSILLQPVDTETPELQRLRQFGACWAWWGVPDDQRQQWWDCNG